MSNTAILQRTTSFLDDQTRLSLTVHKRQHKNNIHSCLQRHDKNGEDHSSERKKEREKEKERERES